MATQKQQWEISVWKAETLACYLRFCIHFGEVPREEQVLMIEGCNSVDKFKGTIKILEDKITEYPKQ